MKDLPPARRLDLIGIGECMVEFHADQPLASAPLLRRGYGGDVLNALVALQRLGGHSGFVTRFGDDPFGPGLLQAWQAEGIDTSHAHVQTGENGMYFISVAADGEREFTYRRHGTPASTMTAGDLDPAYLASSHWLLLSGITQALSASARQTTLAAARIAAAHGVQIAYDPNYRPRLWAANGGLAAARAAFDEIAPLADWLLPSNPVDAQLIDEQAGADEDTDAGFALAGRFAARARNVALKCGANGCILAGPGPARHVPAVKAAKVLDTTGAGDLWNGSFLYYLRHGAAPVEAAAHANRLAAAKLAYRGAIPPAGALGA